MLLAMRHNGLSVVTLALYKSVEMLRTEQDLHSAALAKRYTGSDSSCQAPKCAQCHTAVMDCLGAVHCYHSAGAGMARIWSIVRVCLDHHDRGHIA
jgi:hypothetical protein